MHSKRVAVKVSKKAEHAIRQGHPWIYDQSIQKMGGKAHTGDIAIIFSLKTNRLLAIGLVDLDSPIRIKILHFGSSISVDISFWEQKIQAAFEGRNLLLRTNTTGYRLIHGENDGMPGLIVDVYGHTVVAKIYSRMWLPYLEDIYQSIQKLIEPSVVVQRLSRLIIAQTQLEDGLVVRGELKEERVQYQEHGLSFFAHILKGHKTGSFLDHRHNRLKVRNMSKGRSVLDVFSYSGGFSVSAAAGCAKSVISLDISPQALTVAQENMKLNNFVTEHTCMQSDAFEGLKLLAQKGDTFDLIIVDPPSFAKKQSEIEGALHSYSKLAFLAGKLLAKNGILLLASCSSRVLRNDFFEACERGLNKGKRKFELIEKTYHDIDHPINFPEGSYLKCGYWKAV